MSWKISIYCHHYETSYNYLRVAIIIKYMQLIKNNIITLIEEVNLKEDSKWFLEKAISKGYVEFTGDDWNVLSHWLHVDRGQRKRKMNR